MTIATYTNMAQETIGGFVEKAGKSYIVVRASTVFGESISLKITMQDVAEFNLTQAGNLSSGIRILAGLPGDWRPMSELAELALDWFKSVNIEGMRRAARKVGLESRF